jgi:tetratricopeptide (TPR) repeat protein
MSHLASFVAGSQRKGTVVHVSMRQVCEEARASGRELVQQKKYGEAITVYSNALELLEKSRQQVTQDAQLEMLNNYKQMMLSNRAQCYLFQKRGYRARADAENALALWHLLSGSKELKLSAAGKGQEYWKRELSYRKALNRLIQALAMIKQYDEAMKIIKSNSHGTMNAEI